MYHFNRPKSVSSTTSRHSRRRQTKKARSPERRRSRFESLEDRRVLAVLTVNSVGDAPADTSALTLRDAITLVNNAGDPASLGQSTMPAAWISQIAGNFGSNDTVQFDSSLAGTPIVLAQGELLISSGLTITGIPAAGTTVDANRNSRIFDITAAAGAVTLDGLTLTRGRDYDADTGGLGDGGAIYSASALTVNNINVTSSYGQGGAIYALGNIAVTNSFIGQNSSAGIDSVSGAVTVGNSTVYGNDVGIVAGHGPLMVSNSTVFDNSVGIQAGTLASDGPVAIRSSIVAQAADAFAGHFDLRYGSAVRVTVSNSLIGDNAGSDLVEAPVGAPDANGNFVGGPVHGAIDPMLQDVYGGRQSYNGGPTETLMLLPGSPAIDTGANPDNLTTDQRGTPFARTSGAQTDMGAFELQTSKLTPTIDISAPDLVFAANTPRQAQVDIAGPSGPLEEYLEGAWCTLAYYAQAGAPAPDFYGPSHAGTYTVVASFPGTAEYTAASASATFTIKQAPTTTTLTSTSGTAVFGQYVMLGGVVTDFATGSVTLWEGNTPLQTSSVTQVYGGSKLDGGYYVDTQFGFNINSLSLGAHTLYVSYDGDGDHTGSTSPAFTVVIEPAGTATTLSSSTPYGSIGQLVGQDVTFTAAVAAVAPGAGTPTGSVTFWDSDTLLGAGTVERSGYYSLPEATFATAALSVGTHAITARYEGDGDFMASSATVNQVVRRALSVTTVTSSAFQSAVSYGQKLTLTANVSVVAPDTGVLTGTVQFQLDGQNLGAPTALDASDNASIATSSISLGNHRITAIYSGNSTVDTSTGLLPGTISTYAGNGNGQYTLPSPASAAVLNAPSGVAIDPAGDVFIADAGSGSIRKVDAKTGVISVVDNAPLSQNPYLAGSVYPENLVGMVCDASGDLFYSDPGNRVVEKLSPNGTVTTVAGTFGSLGSYGGYSGDGGQATSAQLNAPCGLALDAAGDLFIVDELSGVVREITPNGIITTVAGGGYPVYPSIGDGGAATAASLLYPTGIAVNAAGDVFIADTGNLAVRKVDHATGIISTVLNFDAFYSTPQGLALDAAGDLFIADGGNNDILKVSTGGTDTTFAGASEIGGRSGDAGYSGDGGPAAAALLAGPTGLAMDAGGNLFVADSGNGVIREVNSTGTINTVAGGGTLGTLGNGGPAIEAPLSGPGDLAVDSAGDLFIVDIYENVVREVTPDGIIHTVAGTGAAGYSGDGGSATNARLAHPDGLAIDTAGDLFIADSVNNVVRKVTPSGVITTVAGNGAAGYSGDGGAAAAASLNRPGALAVDTTGDLFIVDAGNQAVRKVTPSGIITTVATGYATGLATDAAGDLFIAENYYWWGRVREVSPTGTVTFIAGASYVPPGTGDGDGGPATAAVLYPGRIMFDAAGNLLLADAGNGALRSISPAGIITTIAGGAPIFDSNGNYINYTSNGDGGLATSTRLSPAGIAVDATGDLFITDGLVVRKVSPSLVVTKDATSTAVVSDTSSPVFGQAVTLTVSVESGVPGVGTPTGTVQLMIDGQNFGGPLTLHANGTASLTTSALPVGIHTITAVYGGSAQFQTSTGVLASGIIKTVVGTGIAGYSGDGGPAISAQLNQLPEGLAFDSAGNLYIADLYNQVIRKVAPDGTITTVAGNGTDGYSGDGGLATAAQLNYPFDVAVDSLGDLFIDDCVNNVIREVFPNGIITTVAGNGGGGYSGDGGPATSAELYRPSAIALDPFGDLFIADGLNHVVREVTPDGIIHTVAGNGAAGYSGDGGAATAAEMYSPDGVAVDALGDLFISDYWENVIREVTPDGIIHTIAGNGFGGGTGGGGYSGDGGSATTAELFNPEFIRLDAAGDLFIADGGNNVVREVRAGIISTVAGNGTAGYTGDGGPATAAELGAYPSGLAVDARGDLFIADSANNVVREITPTLIVSQAGTTTTLTSSNASVPYGQSVTFTAAVAVVAPGAGAPTGTVTFYDGTTLLATVALNAAGQAMFTTSKLSVATHTITAVYSGDTNFVTSTSTALNQAVLSAQQEAAATTTQVQALMTSGVLNNGNGNALVSKLNNATASISGGNITAGVNQLNAFINQIHALVNARKLDAADAQTLIADATAAITAAVNAKFV